MTVIGYATLGVIPEVKGLAKSLEKQTSGDLTTAGKRSGKKFGDAAGAEAATGFKGKFSGAMKGFAPLAGLVAGVGITAFFKDAIDGASGLVEAGTKLQAIYGDAASEVQNFAATAATDLGQTRLQALDAAATFGTFGKAAKLSGSDLANFSTELVSLSTDLASFFNTDVDTAIQAIGSGLRGEAEPLRQFGVLLDDATLRSEALKQGLIKTTKEALTPQQKVLAAHAVILKQTTDAQGDFERTSGGLANQQRKLTAQWSEMKTAVGAELLPAMTSLVSTLNTNVLPALGEAGGVAKDAVTAFAALPAPIHAGVAAFGALKIAAAAGLGTTAAAGAARVGTAMTGLRIRILAVRDAYIQARSASITLTGAQAGVSLGARRSTAALAGLRAGAIGAGAAMKGFGASALAAFGGPWGIALTAGAIALTHFMTKQDEARQRIDGLTDSLDKQTGALTDNTRAIVAQALEDRGLLEEAERLGLSLSTVTDAALGKKSALEAVAAASREAAGETERFAAANNLPGSTSAGARADDLHGLAFELGLVAEETAGSVEEAKRLAAANKESVASNSKLVGSLTEYKNKIAETRSELQKLIEKEQKRALAAIQQQRDELALITTMQAARKEAREGARTLDITTKAGQENKAALLDLADQWAQTTPKARKAIGGYEEMRKKFVEVAIQMGATKKEAETLANKLLLVPKNADIKFRSEGYRERLAELKALKNEASALATTLRFVYTSQGNNQQAALADRRAMGGPIYGRGTGTSDSNLIWASKGEFMQRKAAVDYYGLDFMRRLNAMQIPKFAQGGPIAAPAAAATTALPMFDLRGSVIQAHDYDDFVRKMQRRSVAAGSDNVRRGP